MAKMTLFGVREIEEDTEAGFSFSQSSDSMKRFMTFKPQPRDILLSSYPKCDSKIVDIIVWKLLYPLSSLPPLNNYTNRHIIPVEMQDDALLKNCPRIFKSYLPCQLLPFYKRAKYIYIIRSPWKACISYYKFLKLMDTFTEPFAEFFKLFLIGDLGYGCYFKHVLPWIKRLEESNVLILCHEHVKRNPRSAMFMIAAFLGECYLNQILRSEVLQMDILDCTNAEKINVSKNRIVPLEEMFIPKLQCSEKQMQTIVKKISEEFEGTYAQDLLLSLLKNRVINSRTI